MKETIDWNWSIVFQMPCIGRLSIGYHPHWSMHRLRMDIGYHTYAVRSFHSEAEAQDVADQLRCVLYGVEQRHVSPEQAVEKFDRMQPRRSGHDIV